MMIFRALLLFVCATSLALSQEALTNDGILKMVKAGMSESLIVSMVGQQPGKYSTKVDDLIALKQAGVSDKIVSAMAAKAAGGPIAAAPATSAAGAAGTAGPAMEIGVYFKKADAWTEVLPEVVNWKTGGALKNLASAGVVKKDLNGNVTGPGSRNSVKTPLDFLIVAAEGVSITE